MNNTNRVYTGKDVEMLTASSTILETAIEEKTFLQSKRSNWKEPFFEDLKGRTANATQNYLGIDSFKDQRQATQALLAIQKTAAGSLAEVKVQIEEDFKDDRTRRTEILKELGYGSYLKKAQNGDQEAMVTLLYQFKQNLTKELKHEIVDRGTAEASLDAITAFADTLHNANITQETFKGSKKSINADAIAEFNGIYEAVISICRIAAKFYKDKPDMKARFSFSKVRKALNHKPGSDKNPGGQA